MRIPDGIHDLSLSDEPARTVFLDTVLGWLDEHLPVADRAAARGRDAG